MRNRSTHVTQDRPDSRPPPMIQRDQSVAKKALEAFFSGKKSKEVDKEWKEVCEATGKLFSKRATTFIEKYGFPRNWDDLLRLIDHDDTVFVRKVLATLLELAPHETPTRRDLLIGKLRVLKMTAEDPTLICEIENALSSLLAMN